MAINKNKISTIDKKSIYFQEVLEKVPSWLLRWGNTIFLIVFILFLLALKIIKYPDIVVAEAKIQTQNPTVVVRSTSTGTITHILKDDQNSVNVNDWVVILENNANYINVKKLSTFLLQTQSEGFWNVMDTVSIQNFDNLGEMRNSFSRFQRSLNEYRLFQELNLQNNQIKINISRGNSLRKISATISNQQELLLQERNLIKQNLERNKLLFKKGVISKLELEKKEIELIQIENRIENVKSLKINTFIDGENVRKENSFLSVERSDRYFQLRQDILNNYNELFSSLENWVDKYVLYSPIDGKLNFYDVRNKNQFLLKDQEIFTVTPNIPQKFYAYLRMPIENSGKVQVGQKVIIKLTDFPFTEFGILQGQIENITNIPLEGKYILRVELPNQLKTSSNKVIDNRSELTGVAEIITQERNLLNRMFGFLKNINN